MAENGKFLYKYLPAELADVAFKNEGEVTLRFSRPKDFNDPYELFLAADFDGDPEMLACYAEAIGELPQFPTTCFSRSPIVTPMWAHYAHNQTGFAIEFSEQAILEHFGEAKFENVEYADGPSHDFSDLVGRVLHIGKPRYTYFLRGAVFNAAYFTKSSCWSYEQERRMVVRSSDVSESDGLMLMNIPESCVTSIVCGARTDAENKEKLRAIAKRLSARFYELRIGRLSAVPFLVDESGSVHSFNDAEIRPSDHLCAGCSEPVSTGEQECVWCQITDETKWEVAVRNPYRIIDSFGGLEKYVAQMDAISRAGRKT